MFQIRSLGGGKLFFLKIDISLIWGQIRSFFRPYGSTWHLL